MKLKFWAKEKKSLIQYDPQVGYYIGSGKINATKLKDYIQAYKFSDTVYGCINLICHAANQIPWYVYRYKGDQLVEVEGHPLSDFLKRPNKQLNWAKFIEIFLSHRLLTGNSYFRILKGSFSKYVELEPLRPDAVRIKEGADGQISYEYNRAGQYIRIPADEIIHISLFNPEGGAEGISPIAPLSGAIDINSFSMAWVQALLEKGARPSLALSTDKTLTKEQRDYLKDQIRSEIQGYENVMNPLILEGGLKPEKLSFSPSEIDYYPLIKTITRKICAAFRVPSELLGDTEAKTYSNIKEARKALYEEAAIPHLIALRDALNSELVSKFENAEDLFFDFDTSELTALREDMDSIWKRAIDGRREGILTINEAREMLNYEAVRGGDVIYAPVSSVPVLGIGAGAEKSSGLIIHTKGPLRDLWKSPERKRAKWDDFYKRSLARERALVGISQKYLINQAERIEREIKKATAVRQIDPWLMFSKKKEAELFRDNALPWYIDTFQHALGVGINATKGELAELKESKQIFTPEHEKALRDMVIFSGTKIAESTMEEILDGIEFAESEGMTVDEFSRYVANKLKDFSSFRARRIARTEVAKVENYGELEGYNQTDFVKYKGWLCSFVELSREAHMEADRVYSASPIELSEPFIVGGEELMFPGDPTKASPGNVINCLCTIYPA